MNVGNSSARAKDSAVTLPLNKLIKYKTKFYVMCEHKNDWDFKISHRKEFNEMIIEQLKLLIEKWPQLRFWQLMCALGYETNPDRFYEESYDTFEQIKLAADNI